MAESCIIIGLAKTGTTGQYKLAKRIYRERFGDILSVFEPTRRPIMKNIAIAARNDEAVVTKVMMAKEAEVLVPYGPFDNRIMVVRDPRDMVVSFLLFRPMLLQKTLPDDVLAKRFRQYYDEIQKRLDGGDRSVFEIHDLANRLHAGAVNWHRIADLMTRQLELEKQHEFFVSKYEDFVSGNREELHRLLGADEAILDAMKMRETKREGSDWLAHISRSRSSGEWRKWFTPQDVDFFRPLFADYMQHFGYNDDWDLDCAGSIDPATSTEYLEKKFLQLTTQQKTIYDTASGSEITSDTVDLVIRKADDGDVKCMRNLVGYYSAQGEGGLQAAEKWRQKAALLGETI